MKFNGFIRSLNLFTNEQTYCSILGDTIWMLNSTVSSRLLQSMAKIEGFQHEVILCLLSLEDSIVGLNFLSTGNTYRIQMDGKQIM